MWANAIKKRKPNRALLTLALVFNIVLPAIAWAGAASFDERFATFPKINSVTDVDWYDPLEIAKGKLGNSLPVANEKDRSIEGDTLKKAIDYVDAQGTVAFLIWQGGKLQFVHYGPGFGPRSRTDTASMHKSVMAILYGAALRDGLIKSIDEPAAKYLPEWANDDRSKITIRNLMNMASGLDDGDGFTKTSAATRLLLSNDTAEAVFSLRAVKPPDGEFDYNNANSEALGIILQRATGMRYAKYLSRTLLAPIRAGDGRVWLDRPDGMAHTFCCLQLTGEDWLRIGLLLKDHGVSGGRQVVPADWIDRMTEPSDRNPNYGLQVWMASPYLAERAYNSHSQFKIPASEPFIAADMFFLDGWGAQRVYVSRAADLVIVRVGNVAPKWDDSYIPNLIMRGLKKTASG